MLKNSVIRKFIVLAAILSFGFAASYANDAVFTSETKSVQEVNIKPASDAAEVNAVNTQSTSETLSNEKFKSAVNNLESAQVDVREQLATYKTLVEQKEIEVNNHKAELSKLKKEYSSLLILQSYYGRQLHFHTVHQFLLNTFFQPLEDLIYQKFL